MPLKSVFNSRYKHTINFEVTCRTYNLYQDELDYIGNYHLFDSKGISGASQVAQKVKNLSAMQKTWVQSLVQEDPLEKEIAAHSSILIWGIPWTEEPGRLQGSCKESDMTKQLTLSQSREYCGNIIS